MITQGELAPGQIVMIHSTLPIKQKAMTMEGMIDVEVPADKSFLTGVPLEIMAVNLPFAICKFLVFIPRIPQQQVILDTRDFNLMEVKPEFVKTYKKLYAQKPQINKNPHGVKQLPPGGSLMDFLGIGMGNGGSVFDEPDTIENKKKTPPASGEQGMLF